IQSMLALSVHLKRVMTACRRTSTMQFLRLPKRPAKISRRQLDRKFVVRFNVSAHAYFHRMKLNQAKWLLKNRSMPVIKIASQFGFESLKHFRSQFKKHFDALPSAMRRDG
ncbi:MAG TPA: hypothetical protein DCF92_05450, partial [Idiomarina sp.]|nr:hypothetical protein [Idiomarina sp.]